jgi:hypothetical protein
MSDQWLFRELSAKHSGAAAVTIPMPWEITFQIVP